MNGRRNILSEIAESGPEPDRFRKFWITDRTLGEFDCFCWGAILGSLAGALTVAACTLVAL